MSMISDWANEQLLKETTYYVFKDGEHDLTIDAEYRPKEKYDEQISRQFVFRSYRTTSPDVYYWLSIKAGTALFRAIVKGLASGQFRFIFTATTNYSGGAWKLRQAFGLMRIRQKQMRR